MNFQQLYTQAGNASLVNDATLAKAAVNDAIRECISEANLNLTESALTNLTAGIYQYDLSAMLPLVPLKVQYIKYIPAGTNPIQSVMTPVSLEELLELQNGYGDIFGPGVFSVPEYSKLWLYPTPSAGDQIRLYYSADFADYTADAAVITQIPARLHYLITYVAARNLAIVNNAAMVAELEPLAQMAFAKIRSDKNYYPSRRPQVARVGLPALYARRLRGQYYSGDD